MREQDPRLRSTLITCPDCSGVLSIRDESEARYLEFVCQVGHTYSLEEVLETKERQLENTLWTAMVLVEHVISLCDHLAADRRAAADGLAPRLEQARAHHEALREIIHATRPIAFRSGE